MRNFKKIVTGIALTSVMSLSAFANGGILVSDLTGSTKPVCEVKPTGPESGILLSDLLEGIIVAGLTSGGIIVAGRDGIIVAGKNDTPACEAK